MKRKDSVLLRITSIEQVKNSLDGVAKGIIFPTEIYNYIQIVQPHSSSKAHVVVNSKQCFVYIQQKYSEARLAKYVNNEDATPTLIGWLFNYVEVLQTKNAVLNKYLRLGKKAKNRNALLSRTSCLFWPFWPLRYIR